MLLENWSFSYKDSNALPCTVPCSMYSVLLNNKLIKDPFYGLNELELTEYSDTGCVFESCFDADNQLLSANYAELTFFGLDTICDIYLNNCLIDRTMNMHRTYTYDVKKLLCEGRNILRLEFSSPLDYFKEQNNKHFLYTNRDTIPGAAHLRKALYMSGWDWGPQLPDMGIFRKVQLDAYNTDKIENVFVKQNHRNGSVTLDITLETLHHSDCTAFVEIDNKKVEFQSGKASITIENPKLWWANGYGEQNLYEMTVTLVLSGNIIDTDKQNIGLRTLTVSTQKDEYGSEFCFVLNGIKIFAMGADYVPQDNILSRITYQRTEKMIKSCVDAHFNCIRVWGGGYYPEDDFFDICDKYGIIVWQDFQIACANVHLTKQFKKELTEEAICNLKRIRNHACLGLICGNNEMELAVLGWGVGNSQLVREDYIELYERIYPELCNEYAPQTFYWPSSPCSGGGFDDPDNKLRGDSHYWEVWHGGIPFTEYQKYDFRFCSEYGFESYPPMKTIESFCEKKDMNCFSRVMENHQKCKAGNSKILMYLSDNYLYPTSFENLVYASQLLQAEAIKCGVEHFRRRRGICMGSLYWQLNDCWPVASWSSLDYYGRYKALHYAAKKFYAPIAIGLFKEQGNIIVNVANETLKDFYGKVEIKICDNSFNVISSEKTKVTVAALKSKDAVTISTSAAKNIYENFAVAEIFDEDENLIMRQTMLLVPPKHYSWLRPDIEISAAKVGDEIIFEVSSKVFAKGVYIDFCETDIALSDNFFDITDSNPYRLTVRTDEMPEDLINKIKIKSVYDIGI